MGSLVGGVCLLVDLIFDEYGYGLHGWRFLQWGLHCVVHCYELVFMGMVVCMYASMQMIMSRVYNPVQVQSS